MDIKSVIACESGRDKAVALVVVAVISAALAVAGGYVSYLMNGPVSSGTWYNKYLILFFLMVLFSIGCFLVFRKDMAEKPERLFFAIVLAFTMGASVAYDINKVSWDLESHFKFMVQWTNLDETVELTWAEYEEVYGYSAQVDFSIAELNAWKSSLNTYDTTLSGEEVGKSYASAYIRLASLPGSLVYVLCGALGLSFCLKYVAVKLTYAFIYSLVCYRGMRLLKSGKMILAAIAMVPSALMMASNLSYDYWLIAFLLYAVSRLVGELQRPDQKLTLKSAALMFVAFFVGCAPKAVYFPIVLLMLLMPKSKFSSTAQSRIYRALCLVVPILIASTFLLNFVGTVSSGSYVGDTRGSSKVNGTEQVRFILSDIPGYFAILFNFLFSSYLFACVHDTYFLAYLDCPQFETWIVTAAVILFVTLTDKEKVDAQHVSTWKSRLWSFLIACVLLGLTCTAMYVSFTSVGNPNIRGVQPRYMFPMLIACLFFLGIPRWGEKIRGQHKALYHTGTLAVLAVVPYICLWQTYISLLY